MVKVLIFLFGLGMFIHGCVCLLMGIVNAIMQNAPFYGVVGIILAIVFIPLGFYLMKLSSDLERQEFERRKQQEIAKREEKERRETEKRKTLFLEQEQWKKEASQEFSQRKYCSMCGGIIKENDKFCMNCGTEVNE